MKQSTWFLFVGGLLAVAQTGCNKGPSLNTAEVTGTVTYDGKPVDGATVTFVNSNQSAKSAGGTTDSQGKFRLQTFVGGTKTEYGAIPGSYTATVVKSATSGSAQAKPPATNTSAEEEAKLQSMSPEEQRAYAQKMAGPGFSADQVTDMSKVGQFKKPPNETGKGPDSELPLKYATAESSDLKYTVEAGKKNDFTLELKD